MTIKELIEQLRKLPQDAEVKIEAEGQEGSVELVNYYHIYRAVYLSND